MNRKLFLLSLVAFVLTLAIAGCQREGCTDPKATNYDPDAKKDNGTCVYATSEPDPTDTIVIPTKEKTFDWDMSFFAGEPIDSIIPLDSIKKYTSDPTYKYVFINIVNKGSPFSDGQEGSNCTNFAAKHFITRQNKLQTRFDINPAKVRGSGTIIVSREGGASLADSAFNEIGMRKRDSLTFLQWGINVERRN